MIITEFELRANWHKSKTQVIVVPAGSIITPTARDFLRAKGIAVQIEGNGVMDFNKKTYSFVDDLPQKDEASTQNVTEGSSSLEKETKPEYMTHLRGKELILKTHPVVALRGQNDLFQCAIIETQLYFKSCGELELVENLEEILGFMRALMLAEVKDEPFVFERLLGLSPQELREQSHYPEKYFGLKHGYMRQEDGHIVARLHTLRSKSRVVELYACRAFLKEDGTCIRKDIVQAFNRLSSAFFILACRIRSRSNGKNKEKELLEVPIAISNHHVHLAQNDLEVLFGKGYVLHPQWDLSQPGQYAAQEKVTLQGPKAKLENVRVLGPVRPETQVEVSVSDCIKLGLTPYVCDSGQMEGTEGIRLIGPQGQVDLARGVMVVGRHIHMPPEIAEAWGIKDGQRVRVDVPGVRAVSFAEALIRVSPHYRLEFHIDRDEGNAALLAADSIGRIRRM